MSILGMTIDYGPFGFIDHYNSDHICNYSDDQGRYKFSATPEIGLTNLKFLADALSPFLPE
jgi:serine/tyrosine/threonine adenylyltransferase